MRVSVIIPAHNAARTVGATIESVQRQTYRDLEVIVIDDGSTDKTVAIVESFMKNDPRIRLLSQPNSGVTSARQRALHEASGDFVAMLDADDLWHPTKIEKQVASLSKAPSDVMAVYCWSRRIDEFGKILSTLPAVRAEGFILCQHVYDNVTGNGSSLMVRRSAALDVGGFRDERREARAQSADDHLLQLRLATEFRYLVVPEYLVGYRVVTESISTNKERLHLSIMRNLEVIKAMTSQVPDWVYRWSYAASLFDQLGFNKRRGNFVAFTRLALKAAWLDPEMFVDRLRLILLNKYGRKVDQPVKARPHYLDINPAAQIVEDDGLHMRRMRRLSQIDKEIFRAKDPCRQTKLAVSHS